MSGREYGLGVEKQPVRIENRHVLAVHTEEVFVLQKRECAGNGLAGEAKMIADLGASYVIIGHSERRADHGETSEIVAAKTEAAFRAGLTPIICIGETLEEREAGRTIEVVSEQLAGSIPASAFGKAFVVAYEPVWAIGTGKVASTGQVGEVHDKVREILGERFPGQADQTPILYGGSMKPDNAAELLAVENVDGGLIGGASLKAEDFLAIYAACVSAK